MRSSEFLIEILNLIILVEFADHRSCHGLHVAIDSFLR